MSTGKLAIATRVNVASETFIAAHINELAPGRTVLLCAKSDGLSALPVPAHAFWEERAAKTWPARRLSSLVTYLRTGSLLELDRRQQAKAEAFCREHDVGVVLAEYGPTGCRLVNLCRRLGVPLFAHFHGFDASKLLRRRMYRAEYRRLAGVGEGFIAPSRFLADRLVEAGFPAARMHVVPCGVKVEDFPVSSRPGNPRRLLAVGRLTEKKAPHLSIAAFAQVAGAFPDVVLEMIGDGELMARCQSDIADRGLEGRVILHGARPTTFVRERMAAASLFVQHSITAPDGDTEGLAVAILEAMMSGLPVISTRHNGIPESVIDGETGLLVDEHDVNGMAAALERLLADDELAARMGAAGARRARAHFSRADSVARLRRILGLDLTAGDAAVGRETKREQVGHGVCPV